MGIVDDVLNRITGRKPEPQPVQQPPQPHLASGVETAGAVRLTRQAVDRQVKAAKDRDKAPGPAARLVNKSDDLIHTARRANEQARKVPPEKEPAERELKYNPPGVSQGPTVVGFGMGGAATPVRRQTQVDVPPPTPLPTPITAPPEKEKTREPTNADRMVTRQLKPAVKSFEEFAGGDRSRGFDR